MKTSAFRSWVIGMAIIGLTACSQPQTISDADLHAASVAAVKFAAKSHKVPTQACISIDLEDSIMVLDGKIGEWVKVAGGKASYRRLPAPRADRLPSDAMASLAPMMRTSDCRHKLVFQRPEFLELKEGKQASILALVNFSDTCPTCGAGYSMTLTQSGDQWKPSQPEPDITWMN